MQRIAINELSEPIRVFLANAGPQQGIVVEDEQGRTQYRIIPFTEGTAADKAAAFEELQRVQNSLGAAMKAAGVTDEDIERAALEGD